jgi:DNA-binding transcriptional regulator YbjK
MVEPATISLPDRPRGAARREALLEAVLRIVAETGIEAVTHRRVAEVAGLPLASTTYWFESKDHLLTAALELAADRDISRLSAYSATDIVDPAQALARTVAALADPIKGGTTAGRASLVAVFALLLEAARRPALREISLRWTKAYLEALGALLAVAGSQRPAQDAGLLVATMDGLLIEGLASGTDIDLREQLHRLVSALVARS